MCFGRTGDREIGPAGRKYANWDELRQCKSSFELRLAKKGKEKAGKKF